MSDKNVKCQTSIGGQAVIEGVMMRGKAMYAMAVRRPDGNVEMVSENLSPASDAMPFLKWPIFRGVVAFVESLVLGLKLTTKSGEIAGMDLPDDEPPKGFEKFLVDKLGDKLTDVMMAFSIILALALSVFLFMWLPVSISHLTVGVIGESTWVLAFIEGFVKISVFLCYILLISRSKDIQRVFAYHGAEHKTINCLESGAELTVDNVRRHTRLHKRCGTSFLLIVMLVSIFVFMFVQTEVVWMRFGLKILSVPLIAGLSYEVIRWAGKSSSPLVGVISFPGLCMQKITTSEPDDDQIEIAIAAMSEVLKHEKP